jgi:hypothetical protein
MSDTCSTCRWRIRDPDYSGSQDIGDCECPHSDHGLTAVAPDFWCNQYEEIVEDIELPGTPLFEVKP